MTPQQAIALTGQAVPTKDGDYVGHFQGLGGDNQVRMSMVEKKQGQPWFLDVAGRTFNVPRV